MQRAKLDGFPPQKRPRVDGLQEETRRPGLSSQSTSTNSYGTGDQFNAPQGNMNITKGPGNQFPGANFQGPVYFNTNDRFNPLQECLKSLAFPEMDRRSHDIDIAAQGTCEWLLRHEKFTRWASCDRALLWIKGKPGSGKSTLLRHVLKQLGIKKEQERKNEEVEKDLILLSFFFHDRGSELQKTPLGLFRALLHQLLQQIPDSATTEFVDLFKRQCETRGKPGEAWQWYPQDLQRSLESLLQDVLTTRPVQLFIDALDECGKENAVILVERFKSLLKSSPSISSKQFRICFTCRHYPNLDMDVDDLFKICVEDENRTDISAFVKKKLSLFRGRTQSSIQDVIIQRAEGVFLWAELVVKKVLDMDRDGETICNIEAEISSVPQQLDDLFRELIRKMDSASLKLIQWICFAMRPLLVDELRWAMFIDFDCHHRTLQACESSKDYERKSERFKTRIQTLSCGLAEVTSDTETVQFIHQSVKDFFIQKGLSALDTSPTIRFQDAKAHYRLSRICIRYLAMEEIGRSIDCGHGRFPFLRYAMTSWIAHTKESDDRSVPQEDLLECFEWPLNSVVERWVRVYKKILGGHSNDCPPDGTSLVHILSRYGVLGPLRVITQRADHTDINIKDGVGRTPLSYAAEHGDEAVVRLLLDNGAHIEAADKDGRTPLSHATAHKHEAVTRLLLGNGAHIEAADNDGWTPLMYAAACGEKSRVRQLYSEGGIRGLEDYKVQLMLLEQTNKKRLMMGTQEHDLPTMTKDEAFVWLHLFEQENKKHLKMARQEQALATMNKHEAFVRLLLHKGANIQVTDKDGLTPLWCATIGGSEAVMRQLLDKGANTEAKNKSGYTPLMYTAERGHDTIVRQLLDKGANTEATDKYGRTPLVYAAEGGHDAAVQLLRFHIAQPPLATSP